MGFFALWIDESMTTASTIPTASHGNTPLVDDELDGMGRFTIDAIEVWRVAFSEEEEADMGGDGSDTVTAMMRGTQGKRASTTVLDAFKTDRNFMALAGQQSYSEGLR